MNLYGTCTAPSKNHIMYWCKNVHVRFVIRTSTAVEALVHLCMMIGLVTDFFPFFFYQESSPEPFQVWDRSTTSDSLLGTARVSIAENLGSADRHGWYKLVGAGDQV